MNAKRFGILLLVGILALLVACGGSDPEPTATPEPQPVATEAPPEPTVEPTTVPTEVPPTAEPEPTAAPVADVDVTGFALLESPEGGYSIQHPSEWIAQGFFGVNLIASDATLLDDPSQVEEGAVIIAIGSPITDLGEGITTPTDAMDEAMTQFDLGGSDMTVVEGPTETTINDLPAAISRLEGAADDGTELSMIVAVVFNEEAQQAVILFGATPIGQETDYIPTLNAIINTVQVFAPTVVETDPITPDVEGLTIEGALVLGETSEAVVAENGSSGWTFTGVAGTAVDIIVEPTDDELDAVVDVQDSTGASILPDGEVDDEFDREEILGVAIPADGEYTVVVRGFAAGGGGYTVSVSEAGTASSTGPVVGTGGGTLAYGDTASATLGSGEVATWTFEGGERDVVDVVATPEDDMDIVLDIVDSAGNSILDDGELDASFGEEHARLITLPADGTYTIVIKGFADDSGDYDVTLTAANNGGAGSILFASDTLEAEETHAFPFTARPGQTVTAIVEPGDDELDVVLSLFNNTTGDEIDSVDLSYGIEEYTFEVTDLDDYYFQVSGFDAEDTGDYDIVIFGGEDTYFELAYGDFVVGELGELAFLDYIISLDPGDDFILDLTPYEDDFDVIITILDFDGNVLQTTDEMVAGATESVQYTFGDEGSVIIRIEGIDSTGSFNFEVQ